MTPEQAFDLNKQVAEALGYRFLNSYDAIRVVTPDKTVHPPILNKVPGFFYNRKAQAIGLRDWAQDTDAALSLLQRPVYIKPLESGFAVVVGDHPIARRFVFPTTAPEPPTYPTLAEAITRAWLAWKAAQ